MNEHPVNPYRLVGADVSLFTGKARAYLRFKGVPFEEVLATREVFESIIVPRTGVRFIPILITDDDQAIQDTTEIIDAVEARYPTPAVYPSSPLQRLVSLLFEIYADEWLVIPAMHYRWNVEENRRFAIAEFGRTSVPSASEDEQQRAGERLSGPFAGALPYLGITPKTVPAIEHSYLGFLSELDAHLAIHPFLLGERPCIGDFGLFGPLYAHLYRDPASGRLMEAHAPHVADWVRRMRDHQRTAEAGCAAPEDAAQFLPDDHVPSTLQPILQRMFREQVPVLLETIQRVAQWAESASGTRLPRALGSHGFVLEDQVEQRAILPYQQWMWQRAHDCYGQFDAAERLRAVSLFEGVPGALAALEAHIPVRVRRESNLLVLDR